MLDSLAESFQTHLPLSMILVRLGMACLLGFIIGFDREYHKHPAGLRTNMLTALASAVFMVMTIEMVYQFAPLSDQTRLDPIRVVEAVTAGVAFLAAGTIIYAQGNVKGLTTGASMWLAGAIGVACGAGFLSIAIGATVFALIILIPLRLLENKIPKTDKKKSCSKKPEDSET